MWVLRGFVPSNSISVYWNKIYNQVLVESSCYKDQQTVIWNLWVRSQSHKRGCLYGTNLKKKKFVDSELAHGCVSKLLLEVAMDLGLNLIVKALILYSGFVLP